jgi:hypothetical protein
MADEQQRAWKPANREAVAADYKDHQDAAAERRRWSNRMKMEAPGEYSFRFGPPRADSDGKWYDRTWVHALKAPDGTFLAFCRCPKKNGTAKECSACDYVSNLYREARNVRGPDAKKMKEHAKDNAAKEHFTVSAQLISFTPAGGKPDPVKDKAEREKGFRPLEIPVTVFEPLNDLFLREDDEGGDFTDPYEGRNVIITRKGVGRDDTEYTTVLARRNTRVENLALLDALPVLSESYDALEDAEIRAKLAGDSSDTEFPPKDAAPVSGQKQIGEAIPPEHDLVEDPMTGAMRPRRDLIAEGRIQA